MITKLNFTKATKFLNDDVLTFIKPLRSKLFRVFQLPTCDNKEEEVTQVLNTLCTRYHKGIWYFNMQDPDTENEIHEAFHLMDIPTIAVSLDKSPELSN